MDLLPFWLLIAIFGVCEADINCGPAEYKNKVGECCPMCGKGYVVLRDCTEMSSTTCIPCIGDTYMSEPNGLNKCFKCKTCDSYQGLYTQQKCTTFNDGVCAVLSGYYCQSYTEDNECTFGVKHSVCLPGQGVKTPGTDSIDTVCEDCKEGYFSTYGINCTVHTDCAIHREELDEKGSPIKDNKCRKPLRNRGGLITAVVLFVLAQIGLLLRFYTAGWSAKEHNSNSKQKPVQETDQDNQQQCPVIPSSLQVQQEESVDRSMDNTGDENDDHL